MTISEFINKVGFKVNDGDVKKVNSTISGIKSTATKLLGAIGIGFSLSQLNALAEEFNGINDKLNYALEYSEDMKDVQKEIVAAANNCKVSYGDMVDTIVNLKQANAEVFPIEEAATFVEYVNKLGKTAGYSDGEISSMQSSLQRVVATGTMGVADITRIARTTPALIEQLCNGLGVTREELEKMADAGQITSETLKTAIRNSAETIDANFDRLDYSIGDAMLNIRNRWGYFVDDLNATTGFTQTIAKGMVSGFSAVMGVLNKVRNGIVWLTDKLGGMENIMKLVGITMGAMGLVSTIASLGKLTDFLGKINDKLGLINKKNLALVAGIVIIALLVEDFINFMQGNDSLFGALLEKAGVDVDAVRQKIIEAWTKIKEFLFAAWDAIKTTCSAVWNGMRNFFAKHGEEIKAALASVWDGISAVLAAVWRIISTTAIAIWNGLTSFWAKHGEQIKTSFVNIWNGIKNRLTAVWNAIKTLATVVFGALVTFWNTWGGTIMACFEGVWNTIKAVFGAALNVLTDLFAVFAALFAGDWTGLWENVKQLVSDIWDGILNIISTILSAVWGVVSSIFGVISGFISTTATGIWTTVTTAFNNMLNGIASTVGKIKSTIVAGFQAAINWITSLPAQAVKWGSDIIDSIVKGITGAVDKVGDAVKGVADKISSFLHFSVPDEGPLSDFDSSMPDMMQLMADGINKGKSVVGNAIKDLTGDMSNDIQDVDIDGNPKPKPRPKPTGGAGAFFGDLVDKMKVFTSAARPQASTISTVSGSNNVSRSVVQNIEINNKYEGDRAGQQKSSQAAKEAGKDITSELARGLSYAR